MSDSDSSLPPPPGWEKRAGGGGGGGFAGGGRSRGGDRDRRDRGPDRRDRREIRYSPYGERDRPSGSSYPSRRGAGNLPPRRSNEEVEEETIMRVSSSSLPQAVAGAIAKRLRNGSGSTLDAAGELSVFQAMKAFAIARKYLDDDDLDIKVKASLEENDTGMNRPSTVIRFQVSKHRRTTYRIHCQHPMKVSGQSAPASTAGALANDIRSELTCSVSALGAPSVFNAAKALAHAREYLLDDDIPIYFKPFYVSPESNVLEFFVDRDVGARRGGRF